MLAIAGGKGGSGKTTTALGLARAFARRGRDPIVIDCDCDMPDLHHHVGLDRSASIDQLVEGHPVERACSTTTSLPGVRFLTAGRRKHVDFALEQLTDWRGPVLLDCPPGIGPDAVRPLRRAERTVLVSTDSSESLADTRTTARSARELDTNVSGLVLRTTDSQISPEWPDSSPILSRVETVESPLEHPQTQATWTNLVARLGETATVTG